MDRFLDLAQGADLSTGMGFRFLEKALDLWVICKVMRVVDLVRGMLS